MITLRIFFLIVLIFVSAGFNTVRAQSDEFTIQMGIVGADAVPPSTPSPVTVMVPSSNQIDVAWGTSTDNVLLSGYVLYRDTVPIATTSLATYSDTGLSAGTLYTYTVKAFDSSFNYSTSSGSVATSTLAAPAPAPAPLPEANSQGFMQKVQLSDLEISPKENSAALSWSTNIYAQFTLRWGKVSSYDLGFVLSDTYKKNHTTVIDDLEPGTTYVYELIAYNHSGKEYVLKRDSFVTAQRGDVLAPSNVSDLRAVVDSGSVYLSWENPGETDFEKVRVVRSYNFYPTGPANGFIVYDGPANSVMDENALREYGIQYYSIFSYDVSGNISSGALVTARSKNIDADIPEPQGGADVTSSTSLPIKIDADATSSIPLLEKIEVDFTDVQIYQNDALVSQAHGLPQLLADFPTILKIPYNTLPENLKMIIVSFKGSSGVPVKYLLRVNKDKTAYEAVIPPLERPGTYEVEFSVYDFHTKLLTSFDGAIFVKDIPYGIQKSNFPLPWYVFFGLFNVSVLWLLYLIFFKRLKSGE